MSVRASISQESESCIEKLAGVFSEAIAVRIPVRVTFKAAGQNWLSENTVIEFGTSREVLFTSTLPLEFAESLRLQNSDGSLDANARVIAVQYHEGRKAVAARFVECVRNWIIQP